ncbi:1,4-dihydroxy-6-naphthoate synthase [Neolewinella agarilytica]|uniref:1,4-dihydroxy-6-naphthoate synthase n=1 Tax=Neolewinella agarilytica TaxID=478744 RepID=UPI0023546613|nr:1,4-dihydroxy-6-naphthoate synthase [Neolewinella agarilytica]
MNLSLGYSPCPNDTFIFDALVHGRIDTEGLEFDVRLGDVEELNQLALAGELDVTKLSYHAFGYLTETYALLNAGSALGRGVGPLLVTADADLARTLVQGEVRGAEGGRTLENFAPDRTLEGPSASLRDASRSLAVAIPGKLTTANYLLGLAYPELTNKTEVLFSDIEERVLSGEFAAGLLIHENRFTYHERGLHKIADLGEFWEGSTGLPIPLGGIVIKRSLPEEVQQTFDRVLARSVQYAFDNPAASADYVAANAQEMNPEVMRQHIALYVNDYSLNLGPEGRGAVRAFLKQGRERGVIPLTPEVFVPPTSVGG